MNSTNEWYEIDAFGDRDYRIFETPEVLPCRLSLLSGSDDALVIDGGVGIGDLRTTAADLVDTDVQLLFTHTHWDHIGAGHQFDRVKAPARECPDDRRITIDSLTDEFVHRPAQFVEQCRETGTGFPDGFDPETYDIEPTTDVTPVEGGDVVDLGDRQLELVDLPGHSPGQLGVLDREAGVLHGGDVVHLDRNLYVHFDDCDVREYVDTFERLVDLRDAGAFDVLTTAHNAPIAGDDLELLDRFHEGLAAIVAGERERDPKRVETNYGPAHRYRIGESEVLTKTSI